MFNSVVNIKVFQVIKIILVLIYLIRYKDPQFREECTEKYLEERSEYRRTGISKIPPKRGAKPPQGQ